MGFGELDFGNFSFGEPSAPESDIIITGKRAELTLDNNVPFQPAGWTEDGDIGWIKRDTGVTDTKETFVEFDVPGNISAGSNIVSAQVEFDVDSTGVPPTGYVDSQLIRQDKSSDVWNGSSRQPWFDDFSSSAWTNIIDTIKVRDEGVTYSFSANQAIIDLVQNWLDGDIDYKEGIVINANPNDKSYWYHVTEVRLIVVYNPSNIPWLPVYYKKKIG